MFFCLLGQIKTIDNKLKSYLGKSEPLKKGDNKMACKWWSQSWVSKFRMLFYRVAGNIGGNIDILTGAVLYPHPCQNVKNQPGEFLIPFFTLRNLGTDL